MSRFLSVLKISFKKTTGNFPMIISGTLIIIIASLLLVYGLYLATGSEDMSNLKVDVGVINEDSGDRSDFVFNYVENGSSIKDLVRFVWYTDIDDAVGDLRSNEIAAYSHVPEGYFSSITDGTNIPLRVIFDEDRDNPGIGFFLDIIDATAQDVALCQASVYAAEEIGLAYGQTNDERREINKDLNNIYLNAFINHESMYDTSFVGSAKGLTLRDFYSSTLILLVLMLSGVSFISVLKPDSHEILCNMRRRGFPLLSSFGSSLTAALLFTITIDIIYAAVSHEVLNPLGLFLICYCTISFNCLIYRLVREDTVAMLMICALSFLMLFLCGAVVPVSFLPDVLIDIGRMTHVGNSFEMLKGLTVSVIRLPRYLFTLCYCVLFTAVSVIGDNKEVNRA